MARPALSDEEKRRRGTFDPRYAAEERAKRASETTNVVTLPTLDKIPACRFPLKTKVGKDTYDRLIRILHEQKRLTTVSHLEVEMLAVGLDSVHLKMDQGKAVSASAIVQLTTRLDKLQRADVDPAYAGSSGDQRRNKFAYCGFANRSS